MLEGNTFENVSSVDIPSSSCSPPLQNIGILNFKLIPKY